MELESCAGREGLVLAVTTKEPSQVHLGQQVGEARAREEQAAKERSRACCLGSQAPPLKEDLAEGGLRSFLEDGLCRKGLY